MPKCEQGIILKNVSLNDANHVGFTELLDALKRLSANCKDLAFEIDPSLSSGEPVYSSLRTIRIRKAYSKNERYFGVDISDKPENPSFMFGGKSRMDILQFTQRILRGMKYGDELDLGQTLQEKIEIAKRVAAEQNAQRNNPYAGRPNNSKNTLRNEDIDL